MSSPYQIPVLQKAIHLLHAVAEGTCEPTTNSLGRALKIAPATSYRIVQTFLKARWLHLRDDGRYELGLGLLPITQGVQQHPLLRRDVADVLDELTTLTGITSKVSALDGDDAVTLMRVNSKEPMSLAVQAGSRFHLAFGSSGAALLGSMDETRVQHILDEAPAACWAHQTPATVMQRVQAVRLHGLAEDLGGFRPDVFGLSAPLFDHSGKIQGALTLTGLLHGRTEKDLQTWRQLLRNKAAALNHPPAGK